jgi:hypothetical protein
MEEIFVTEMELDEFIRSIVRITKAWIDYCDDTSNPHHLQEFCNTLGAFIIINSQQLKCLLDFIKKSIDKYEEFKALHEKN